MKEEIRGHFLGIHQQHSYNLYHLMDEIIQYQKPMRFVEIGTGAGAMACFLGMYAWQRGTHLLTLDINEHRLQSHLARPFFEQFNVQYEVVDCFSATAKSLILNHMDTEPTLMFCDGGNKVREFNYFKDWLPENRGAARRSIVKKHKSVIVTHDYPLECGPDQIDTDGWHRKHENRWEDTKSMVWVKDES